MGALLGLAGAVLLGHIAIGAAIGSLTVPAWIQLGSGIVSVVQLDAKLLKILAARRGVREGNWALPRDHRVWSPPARICFQHPRVGVMWICVPQ